MKLCTISWKKTFSTPVAWVTPVANTDLVTKDYVDTKVQASSAWWTSWVTINRTCTYWYEGGCQNAPACDTWWTDLWTSSYSTNVKYDSSHGPYTVYTYTRFCAKKM